MPLDRFVPVVQPVKEGERETAPIPDLRSLNDTLRKLTEMVERVEGRSKRTILQQDLVVQGKVAAGNAPSNVTFPAGATNPYVMEVGSVGNQTTLTDANPFLVLSLNQQRSTAAPVGHVSWFNRFNVANDLRVGQISVLTDSSTDSGAMVFYTSAQSVLNERMRLDHLGVLGVGKTNPDYVASIDSNSYMFAKPAIGQWTVTSTTTGTGKYIWDTEDISDTAHFARNAAKTDIQILRTATYMILAQSQATASPGNFTVNKNATVVATSAVAGVARGCYEYVAVQCTAGDLINIQISNGDRFGDANFSTLLTIYRLN